MKRWPKGLFLALCVASWLGCSAERKLSHVEPREILSRPRTEERQPASARARLLQPLAFSSRCPAGLRDNLPLLSEERVNFPECPGKLEIGRAHV